MVEILRPASLSIVSGSATGGSGGSGLKHGGSSRAVRREPASSAPVPMGATPAAGELIPGNNYKSQRCMLSTIVCILRKYS
jgi:hypothetical protein